MPNVLSRYEIFEQLSERAGTQVCRGVRIEDRLPVVLKILNSDNASFESQARFRREFELLSRWNLPGVIRAYALEHYRGGLLMALEDIGGRPLDRLDGSLPLAPDCFLRFAIKAADALGFVHQHHVIHRDINPSHLIVNRDTGDLRLIGFGLAGEPSQQGDGMRPPAAIEGALAFMSPEQTGRMNRVVDQRTDLYSLGATLYYMATGRLPFESDDAMELVHCHLARTPEAPHAVNPATPEQISGIVLRLMAKTAENRYQSAWGLKADLERCLDELTGRGRIGLFTLGRGDFSDCFRVSRKLYGREREREELLAAFERARAGGRECVAVSGAAGSGKTALIHELSRPVAEASGYFIEGKFDPLRRETPFFGWIQAFSELTRCLLMENEADLAAWKDSLRKAVGRNGKALVDVIPDLGFVLGPQPDIVELPPAEARNRFRRVFLEFVRVFAHADRPLTVFLDDVQWMDEGSALLIESLLNDPDLVNFLFVAAFRDDETGAPHALLPLMQKAASAGCRLTSLSLRLLGPEHVEPMIADMLQLPAAEVRSLARLVHGRTEGNPFFVREFMLKLHDERLVHFDAAWRFDYDSIARAEMPDTVARLIVNRFELLTGDGQEVLKAAACIGSRFTKPLLTELTALPEETVAGCLDAASREGFVLVLDHRYAFVHDRIREAVYSRIDSPSRALTHRAIGRALVRGTDPDRIDDVVFDIVHHFNLADEAPAGPREQDELMALNMRAGLKAMASIAYETAAGYLRRAARLLPDDRWSARPAESAVVFTALAEAAYLTGDYDEARACLREALQHAALLDKVKAYEIAMRMHVSLDNMQDALRTGREALRLFRVFLPGKATALRVLGGMLLLRLRLGAKTRAAMLRVPEANDPHREAAARLIMNCTEPAYIGQPNLYPVVIERLLLHSLEQGNTKYSSFAYIMYGVILCSVLNDIEGGHRFAALGLELLNRCKADELKCRIFFFFGVGINHWKKHLRENLDYLWSSFVSGRESGDAGFASYALNHYHFHLFFMGEPLEELEKRFAEHYSESRKTMQIASIQSYELWYQVVSNLRGRGGDATRLQGPYFREDETVAEWTRSANYTTLGFHSVAKQMLFYLNGDYGRAIAAAEDGAMTMKGVQGMIFVPAYHGYHALALLAACPSFSGWKRKRALNAVKAVERRFERWARHAPMNYGHTHALIKAERRGLNKRARIEHVLALYNEAIEAARLNGYLMNEALANERAARFLTARGLVKPAFGYLRAAYELYTLWGGKTVLSRLEREFPDVFAPRPVSREDHSAPPQSSVDLDFHSVLKASQAIAGEIGLDRLMDRMLRIVIENAGAQKGRLLLEREGVWTISARCDMEKEASVEVAGNAAQGESGELAAGVVHFTAHRKETVLLDDAAHEGAFAQDPSIKARGVKSLLCAPLLLQGRLIGILYLENNAATHAFTPARLRVLEILLAQAAPALENARIYEALRESELKFRALAETSTAAIFVYRDKILYMNPAGEELAGYSRDELLTMSIWDLVHPDYREAAKQRVLGRMRGDSIGIRFEYQVVRKDGQTGWVDFSATSFRYEGRIAGLGVAFNITERKKAEAERAKLENQLRQAQKMEAVGTLAGGVAHDFNNILTAITGYGSMVRTRMAANDPLRGYIDDILSSARRAANLTRSLLAFSRKQQLEPKPEDLNHIVQGIDKLLLRVIGEDIEFRTVLAPEKLIIMADVNQIEQVLMNLAANARDAMPDGGILTIRTERVVINGVVSVSGIPKGAYAVISVSDTGMGMDEETRKRIFEPFFTTKDPGKGTGLGLSMAYGIIKQHEGELTVYSEPGKGTTFKIYLKLVPAGAATVAAAPAPAPVGGTETILVAEDDFTVRRFLRTILEQYGYTVIEASNGEDAVLKFSEHRDRTALIIMDVVMPKMNGREAYGEITKLKDGVPVIFASGYTADIISRKGVLEDGLEFISKPIDSDALLVKMREILSRKKS